METLCATHNMLRYISRLVHSFVRLSCSDESSSSLSLSLLRIQDTMRIIPAAPLSASRSRDVPNATESRVADPLRESAVRTVVVTLGPASRAVERPGRGGAERGALPRAASLKAYHREREKECEREGRKREGRRSGEKKK